MIKKGLVKKLAHQYKGPFRILDVNLPNVLIRPANKRTAKPKWKTYETILNWPKINHVLDTVQLATCDDVDIMRPSFQIFDASELQEELPTGHTRHRPPKF